MITKILIGTNNPGKLREHIALLAALDMRIHTPASLGISLEIEESGKTYQENAHIKALAFSRASGLPVLADDTGLEVAALDGLPGLHSHRFSPDPSATDADRRQLLIAKLGDKPQPWSARFVCTAAFVLPGGQVFLTSGECTGRIIPEERGETGFGYDRIFLMASLGKTMAELSLEEKNHLSHRARAVQAMIPRIVESI
jgi:XTP/dITP diphosphohydrolase